jgi:hypothetical protein
MIRTEEDAIVAEQNAVARELRNALGYEDPDREPLPVTPALAFRLAEVAAMAEESARLRAERADMIAEQQAALSGLLAERDASRKAAEELRLTLLAEQGDIKGAPAGWKRTGSIWFRPLGPVNHQVEVRRSTIHPIGEPYQWTLYTPTLIGEGYAPYAREAMKRADKAFQEKA